jgi:hypothetical protein
MHRVCHISSASPRESNVNPTADVDFRSVQRATEAGAKGTFLGPKPEAQGPTWVCIFIVSTTKNETRALKMPTVIKEIKVTHSKIACNPISSSIDIDVETIKDKHNISPRQPTSTRPQQICPRRNIKNSSSEET